MKPTGSYLEIDPRLNTLLWQKNLMSLYVMLMNWTDKGIQQAKDSPGRLQQTRKFVESLGGKILSFLYTIGEYDAIAIIELPNDETFMKFLLTFGAQGNVRRTALKAYDENEALKIFSGL